MSVTPETNVARIVAEALARTMTQAQDDGTLPVVEEIAPATARFIIETPMGSFSVAVRAL